MAEALGSALLSEVEECSLNEILQTLRKHRQPNIRAQVHIPFIDDLTNVFTQAQQMPRPGTWQPSAQRTASAPVIEIASTGPASGKTQLLHLIAAKCLLGTSTQDDNSGVLQASEPGAIVWLDLSERFSPTRLLHILKSRIASSAPQPSIENPFTASEDTIHRTALEALDHVHIFRPQSTQSLISTVRSVQPYLFNTSAHCSANRPLAAILISDLSAFYWQDRHDSELGYLAQHDIRPDGASTSVLVPTPFVATVDISSSSSTNDVNQAPDQRGPKVKPQPKAGPNDLFYARWRELVSALHELQRTFGCVIVGSNMGLGQVLQGDDGLGLVLQPHLPVVWNGFVTARFLMVRRRPEMIGAAVGVEEALAIQKAREERMGTHAGNVVAEVRINAWRSEGWTRPVRNAVAEMGRKRHCYVRLDEPVEIMNQS